MPEIFFVSHPLQPISFWCNKYSPDRYRYEGQKYNPGEKVCCYCAIMLRGIIFRAKFHCRKIKTPLPTNRQITQMFRFLFEGEKS